MNYPKDTRISKGKSLQAAKAESKKAAGHMKDVMRQTGPSIKGAGQRIRDRGR